MTDFIADASSQPSNKQERSSNQDQNLHPSPSKDSTTMASYQQHLYPLDIAKRSSASASPERQGSLDIIPPPAIHSTRHSLTPSDLEKGDGGIQVEKNKTKQKMATQGTLQDDDSGSSSVEIMGIIEKKGGFATFYALHRIWFHVLIGIIATGWWIVGLVMKRKTLNWVVPFLVWLCIIIRLITFHFSASNVLRPIKYVWRNTANRVQSAIPGKLQLPFGAILTIAIILIGTFVTAETADNKRVDRAVSLFGLVVVILGLWATSRNRRAINWRTPIVGTLAQFIIGLFVLRTTVGYDIFSFISGLCRSLLGFANNGLVFLTDDTVPSLGWFLVVVLPAIIFFISIVQLLYYYNILQWFIRKFAVPFFWAMHVSGAEAVVAAASPFIGQGESVILIKPLIPHLTKAELHQIMTSGFATIAGSVLVAYIGLGISPQVLISSCVMSIPASLAFSKLRYPEEEETLSADQVMLPDDDDEESKPVNCLHAFIAGSWLGLKIAGMIAAALMCILGLIGLFDGLLGWWGKYLSIDNLTLEMLLGYICYPVAFLLGVPRNGDLLKVGQLIGLKIISNEFVAYSRLADHTNYPEYSNLNPRSKLLVTYALCGFGNLGSLGAQIGVLTQIAPKRSGDVSGLAFSALITGIISTLSSAMIAGMVITDPARYVSG